MMVKPICLVAALLYAPAHSGAQAQSLRAADLAPLCAGWAGKWRAVSDVHYEPGNGWKKTTDDTNWRVDTKGEGRCRFVFEGKDGPEFEADTNQGFYDVTFWTDGKPGAKQRGRILSADIADPRAWNLIVEATRANGQLYQMQMTMAGDTFVIYMAEPGSGPTKLRPHSITMHQRR